jgi:hypothetical protein
MKNTPKIYLLTLNSPSRKPLRLWMGRSVHALRHCSAKEIGSALVDLQKSVDNLQKHMRTLNRAKEQLASASPEGGKVQ